MGLEGPLVAFGVHSGNARPLDAVPAVGKAQFPAGGSLFPNPFRRRRGSLARPFVREPDQGVLVVGPVHQLDVLGDGPTRRCHPAAATHAVTFPPVTVVVIAARKNLP